MRRIAMMCGILAAGCRCGFALNPSLDVSQYTHTAWTVRAGFSLGNIYTIAQTPDGYLWLGGEFGLSRFDGVRSRPWYAPTSQRLPDNNINSLLVTRDGTLWIGTFAGLVTWSGGKLVADPELGREFVASLFEDREGTVWAGTLGSPTGRLCAVRSGRAQCYGEDGSFGRAVWASYEDSSGNLWAAAQSGLWRMKPGAPKRYPTATELIGLSNTDDGRLLIAMHAAGLLQFAGDKIESYPIRGTVKSKGLLGDRDVDSNKVLRDRDGGLWIGTVERGLIHVHKGRTDVFTRSDGLSGDVVLSLFEDREGNVWVATTGGLDRFRELPVTTISVKQGLSSDATQSVLAARDGSIWVGAHDGLTRWKDGQATIFRKGSGLPDDAPQSLFQDDGGRIWVSTHHGLAYFKDVKFVAVNSVPGGKVHFITGDNAGNLWLSEHRNLLHLLAGRLVEQIPWSELGRRQSAEVLLSGGEPGGVWLGFWLDGGVSYFKDRRLRASYTAADGLGEGPVGGLQLDPDGTLWAATQSGGLSRVKDGRIATLTSRNGLPCDSIHWTTEDDDRSLWLYTACGLVRIRRTELDAWIADPKRRVETTVWDAADGVRLRSSAASEYGPRVAKSTDGKLWFVTGEGVQIVDPHRLVINNVPPPVHIERIIADDKPYDLRHWMRLPPNVRNLRIDYTALSLVAPEKIHFKYKLEGQNPNWHEVVNERQATYTNLPPRNYRFRVMASNNSGVWNETGDTLEFSVAPAFYQTNWFLALCAAGFLALLWAGYQFRVQQLQRDVKKLRDVIETIPAMAWTALPDGSNEFVNKRWKEYTGLSAADTAESGWTGAVHPEDLQPYAEKWRASLATGEPFESEARFRSATNGEYRWLLARGVPLREEHGNIVRWYGILTDIEDRKRAEETLRESETRFRTFVDHVGDTILVQDEQGTIVDVNRQGCEGLGYTREEVVGMTPSASFCLDADREAPEMEWAAQRAAVGETLFDRHRHRRKDGTEFPVEVHTTLFWYGGRRFLLKVVRDISESLRAEEAVRRSEKQLRDVIDTIPAYVWSVLPDGSLDFINQRCLEFSGFSFEQSVGRGWEAVLHPEDCDRFLQESRAAISSGQPMEAEARYRRADGQYRWLLVRAMPLRDETGTVVKWYGANTDIDDRKRAEQALKRSEAYLADAQKLTHTGAWATDARPQPLYWSQELFRLYGLDPQQGFPTHDEAVQRVHPEDRDKYVQAFHRVIHQKVDSDVEFRTELPDGTIRYLYGLGHPILNAHGDVVEVVGTTVDITEREKLRQLEDELRHVNRVSTMGALVASLSHDINQPITAVITSAKACLRWLDRDPPELERARAAATRIERDGERAAETIVRLRAFYKKGAPPQPELLDVNEVACEMIDLLRSEARRYSISMRTDLAAELPRVRADHVQLQQVFMNLMLNAIEAMKETSGELIIRSHLTENCDVQISIVDTGVGLPAENVDKVFNAFFTTKEQGSGMGLAISRSIIESHGGRLWACANAGRGATFHFTVPIKSEAGA